MNVDVCDTGISPYTVFMLLAFGTGFLLAYLLLKREAVEARLAGLSVLMNAVFVVCGAKFYTLIFSFRQGLTFLNAPFSSAGGLIGMLVGIVAFNFICHDRSGVFARVYTLSILLMYSISKLGCFSVGCCYGIPYDGPGCVHYTASLTNADSMAAYNIVQRLPKENVFPVQLVETIVFAAFFLICLYLYLKRKREYLVQTGMILGAVGKFSLEFLRAGHTGYILNPNQIICLVLFTFAIGWCILKKKGWLIK